MYFDFLQMADSYDALLRTELGRGSRRRRSAASGTVPLCGRCSVHGHAARQRQPVVCHERGGGQM